MSDLNLKKRDYREAKGNTEHFNERRQEKQAEIAELEADLAYARDQLKELQNRLATAKRDMAIGRLSADGFMELKREIADKEAQVKLLGEAIATQKGALAIINEDYQKNRRNQHEWLKRSAADLGEQFADEVAALAGDRIQDLAHALVASSGRSGGFSMSERQRNQEFVYQAIGEALCRRVFPNEKRSLDFIPDLLQARQYIGEMIEQRD
jgi:chromosome segregation ATPase